MWTLLTAFGLAVASALLPWVNAELILLAIASPLTSALDLAFVVVAVTAGQVTGKTVLYWMARRAPQGSWTGRFAGVVERWRNACHGRPASAQVMMLVSAVVGVPPFYVTTMAAGALRISFPRFLGAAVLGRLLHFAAVAAVPALWRL